MTQLFVATWNLDAYRPDAASRLPKQTQLLHGLAADVLVLTEVVDTVTIPGMEFWHSDPGLPPYKAKDRAVAVASHWPGRALTVKDSRLSVCIELVGPEPIGRVIVYGTVLPYGLDGVRQKAATAWERHRQAVTDVQDDITRLQADPSTCDAHLVLAGDFNTNLDGTSWYGDAKARLQLVKGLSSAGLVCHTLENIRDTRGSDRAIVDHIWSTAGLVAAAPLEIWCDRDERGRLSDHNGTAIRLSAER